jgi:hypothetical protein
MGYELDYLMVVVLVGNLALQLVVLMEKKWEKSLD